MHSLDTEVVNVGLELDILVVGGGISGFSAAVALSRLGHNVTLLEQSPLKREAGYMITIGATGTRVLRLLNFDFAKARAVDTMQIGTFDGETLESTTLFDLDKYTLSGRPGQAKTFYRPDLHNELKRLALQRSQGHKTPTVLVGSRVVAVDIENATATLADGTIMTGDLIIGADGERSLVKAAFGEPETLRQGKFKILRSIVPTERLLNDEKHRRLLEITKGKFAIFVHGEKVVSWFEGRDGMLQDLEAGYMYTPEDKAGEPDDNKAKDKLLGMFSKFNPDIVDVLRKAEVVKDWEVYQALPLKNLSKHKAILIGDASHSMLPTTGQGGTQSLEDVGALAVLLSNIFHKDEIRKRFKLIEDVRKERARTIQGLSGQIIGFEEMVRELSPNHFLNKTNIMNAEDHLRFNNSYDVIAESKDVLERALKARANL